MNSGGRSPESLSPKAPFAGEGASTSVNTIAPRISRFTELPASPESGIRSFNHSAQSLPMQPPEGIASTGNMATQSSPLSLEQSVRTFHLFGILRQKDLPAISAALRDASRQAREESIAGPSLASSSKSNLLNGTTILHLAIQCAESSTVEYILSQPAADPDIVIDLNARDKDGNTALHLAALLGRSQVVCVLLGQEGINDSLPNQQGQLPIDLARNGDVVQQLQVARALSIDTKINELHQLVARMDYEKIQEFLGNSRIQALIDLDATELATDPAVVSAGGTLLHEAARKRDTRLIEILLLNGADPFRSDRRGKLPQDVTKDDRTRATLKKSPAAAAAQRGIQERTILRSGALRPSAASGAGPAEIASMSKEAREMKGYLKKWTNYTGGYKLRWFVLDDGVLSYYKHQGIFATIILYSTADHYVQTMLARLVEVQST